MNRLSIKTKLILLVLFSVIALAGVGIIGNSGIRNTSQVVDEIGQVRLPSIVALGVINEGKTAIRVNNLSALQYKDDYSAQGQFTGLIGKNNDNWARINKSWKLYEPLAHNGEEADAWKVFVKKWNKWAQGEVDIAATLDELGQYHNEETHKRLFATLQRQFESQQQPFADTEAALGKLVALNAQFAETSARHAAQTVKTAQILMLAGGLVPCWSRYCWVFLSSAQSPARSPTASMSQTALPQATWTTGSASPTTTKPANYCAQCRRCSSNCSRASPPIAR